jgi:MoxR-like ATPase
MDYKRIFDPVPALPAAVAEQVTQRADRRDGRVYVYTDEIVLAVNVALVTARPLLVRGPSGSGKSTLAQNVALQLGLRYHEEVITSDTQARDLLWRFDALRRLNDAQARSLKQGMAAYLEPGVLWWAFDPTGAKRLAKAAPMGVQLPTTAPGLVSWMTGKETVKLPEAVVLLDEIDKADPDVPNNLLVPLGSLQFDVPDLLCTVKSETPPLVVITTNDERELPNAFLRRCVILQLPDPDKDNEYRPYYKERLLAIAKAHWGEEDVALYDAVADLTLSDEALADRQPGQTTPSPAEYLDTVRACLDLNIRPGNANWDEMFKRIAGIVLRKSRTVL